MTPTFSLWFIDQQRIIAQFANLSFYLFLNFPNFASTDKERIMRLKSSRTYFILSADIGYRWGNSRPFHDSPINVRVIRKWLSTRIFVVYRMTASAWDKFLLLSWKNWIIQIRHPVQTVFEILVPVVVCALLIVIRGLVESSEYTKDFKYPPFSTIFIGDVLQLDNVNPYLAYSPENPVLEGLVNNVASQFQLLPSVGIHNATDLGNYASTFVPFASFEFDDSLRVRNQRKLQNSFKLKHQCLTGYHRVLGTSWSHQLRD